MRRTHHASAHTLIAVSLVACVFTLDARVEATSHVPVEIGQAFTAQGDRAFELVGEVRALLELSAREGKDMKQELRELTEAATRDQKAGKLNDAFAKRFLRLLKIMNFSASPKEVAAFVKDVTGETYDGKRSGSLGLVSEAMDRELFQLGALALKP